MELANLSVRHVEICRKPHLRICVLQHGTTPTKMIVHYKIFSTHLLNKVVGLLRMLHSSVLKSNPGLTWITQTRIVI